jgi:transaldolase
MMGPTSTPREEDRRAMKLFIDTGSVEEVEEIAAWGVLRGATTNPSLLASQSGDPGERIVRICEIVNGPVSAEVVSDDPEEMVVQGRALAALHEHVVVKVPFGAAGLQATRSLSDAGIGVNMTLVFSPNQALLAAEAGARYISCFMGRLDDVSIDSASVLGEIVDALRGGGLAGTAWIEGGGVQVLAASIRHPEHVVMAARLGCEVATVPGKVLRQMLNHPLTSAGIEQFEADWRSEPALGEWLDGLITGAPRAAVAAAR